jgi:uncharacterized protein YjlB
MQLAEELKRAFERVTGRGRPSRRDFGLLVRSVRPKTYRFADDGRVPNNPDRPLLFYRGAVLAHEEFDPAAVLEEIFAANGWTDSWRDGIYKFQHFHTATHEVLGIARGRAKVQFGGSKGRALEVAAGDVIVLPAGTGHRRLGGSKDLLVVGAYPVGGDYDEPKPDEIDHDEAKASIAKVPVPKRDPLYGPDGPLPKLWAKRGR